MIDRQILDSFGENINIAVIGASGAIGRAFVRILSTQSNVNHIYAFSRSETKFENSNISTHEIDLLDEASIQNAAQSIGDEKIDITIVATGILHNNQIAPEKSLRDLDMDQFQTIFTANTFGPALIAKHFLPLIPKGTKSVFGALSARVGSIEDNHMGGWYAYRASKTALNMILKTASIEMQRRFKQSCIIGLHPGTVESALSEPFSSNVKKEKLFTPEYSAECLIRVINSATPEKSGKVFDWDNQEIPY